GRAAVLLIAGKEIEKEARLVQAPAPTAIAMPEDRAEQPLCGGTGQKMLLVGRALIGVSRRHGDAVYAECGHVVEESRDTGGIGPFEKRRVDRHPKALGLGGSDRRDGTSIIA